MPHPAYGLAHQRTRAKLLPLAEGQPCPRCGQPMQAWQPLDLGHTDPQAKRAGLPGDRIEHAACNRSAGDREVKQPAGHLPSRAW